MNMKAGEVSILLGPRYEDFAVENKGGKKGENKARLWSNVKWCRVLNVGTSVSVRAWLEGVVCKAVLSGQDPAMSAG